MSIIAMQRRMMEIGRLRIGQQVPVGKGTRPVKLETWRFTSANQNVIRKAAELYGGTPQPWQAPAGPQFELISEATTLPVLVPPADLAFSQWLELWSGGGCQRRCDGSNETISDGPCLCDPENRECKIHTRLSILLSHIPGLGVWRVESSGWYAATELSTAVDIIRMAAARGQMLPAQLRLEQRVVKRGGQTRRFAVPVLDVEISPAQLLTAPAPVMVEQGTNRVIEPAPAPALEAPAFTPVPESVPERPVGTVAEQAATQRPSRRRASTPPVPATGLKPRTAAQAAEPAPEPITVTVTTDNLGPDDGITPAQLRKLSIQLKEAGFDTRETRHGFVSTAIGRDIGSAKDLTRDEASTVIDLLETPVQPTLDGVDTP